MTKIFLIELAKRLLLILMFTRVVDLVAVHNLPDDYFSVGRQVEIIMALALAWRYCMPLAPWKPA